MSTINITNVINVSVSTPPTGLADYQVSNIAAFTKEVPVNVAITASNPGIYVSPADVLADWGADSEVYAMANAIFSQTPNILSGRGSFVVFPMAGGDVLATVIAAGIKVQFFGAALWAGYDPIDAEIIAASTACEPLRVKLGVGANASSAMDSGNLLATLHANGVPHTRKFVYTKNATATAEEARIEAAAYLGRAMCVNFAGTNTTNTMHLKQLVGIAADLGITQTILDRAQTIGVDVYPSLGGRASLFTSGADSFFDEVYNLDWLVFALEVAGFNVLALTGTKVPQTEQGVAVLVGGYIDVLKQAVRNGYLAPGTWNSPELFGDPDALRSSIDEIGYYIYSAPVGLQSEEDRMARKAPIIQIAIKLAGAIHSSDVIVSVNA